MIRNRKIQPVVFPKRPANNRPIIRDTVSAVIARAREDRAIVDGLYSFGHMRRMMMGNVSARYDHEYSRLFWRHKHRPLKRVGVFQSP